LDPIYSATKNPWAIPTFAETQRYIHETVDYLKNNDLTFRIEKLPLCYMTGFEEFSSDIRREIFDEKRIMSFLRTKSDKEDSTLHIEKKTQFHNAKQCDICYLKQLCAGINPNYVSVNGDNEVYPIFDDPMLIVNRAKNTKQPSAKKNSIMDSALSDMNLFDYAIRHKSNKNNIYDTYSFFLMNNAGARDEDYIFNHWVYHVDEIKKGLVKNLLSFYVHIPFCVSNCAYCVYPSTTLKSETELEEYLDFLIQKMEKFAPIFKGLKFKTLYFGGGSPNIFSSEQMDKLFSKLFSLYDFEEYAEKAIEFNPRNTDIDKLKVIEKFGFNKLSIGVQSLSKRVLELNERGYQTIGMIKNAVELFNNLNLNYINIDLVIGLKGDTPEDFLSSFENICKIAPTNICIYPLKTNDAYIKKNYGSVDNFEKFYYPLFDEITEKLVSITAKYDYLPIFDMDKPSYVRPIIFSKNSVKRKRIDWSYAHFSIDPFSNFCLGYYSHSRISGVIDYRYSDKSNFDSMFLKKFSTNPDDYTYLVDTFSPIFEKVKFITQEFYKHREIDRKKYIEFYGKDILLDFPYAINALKALGIIKVEDKKIVFKDMHEKEAYPCLLFFVGRENVMIKFPEYTAKTMNKSRQSIK
jgi:coproporphyrinogen III oxidase-like Fe-S oxidoreductase